jgi:hypothetical protein
MTVPDLGDRVRLGSKYLETLVAEIDKGFQGIPGEPRRASAGGFDWLHSLG